MEQQPTTPDALVAQLDFDKGNGLLPAIVQDAHTSKVLMLGYMNLEACQKTIAEGKVTFFSRSKQRLWTKGETSGYFLIMTEMLADCDNDTLLIKAEPKGPACHTGADTYFFEDNKDNLFFIRKLEATISHRHQHPQEGSYTTKLFAKGMNKIAQKVGEEAVELVIEAKDDNKELFLGEAADLLFHYLVLLEAKAISLDEVLQVLIDRQK